MPVWKKEFYFFLCYMYTFHSPVLLHYLELLEGCQIKSGKTGLPCLGPDLKKHPISFHYNVNRFHDRCFSSSSEDSLFSVLFYSWMGVGFCQMCLWHLLMWSYDFSFCSLLTGWVILIDFLMFILPFMSGIRPTWSWYVILIHYLILFGFLDLHSWEILVYSFSFS